MKPKPSFITQRLALRGMTLKQWAAKHGFTQKYVSQVINGGRSYMVLGTSYRIRQALIKDKLATAKELDELAEQTRERNQARKAARHEAEA